MRRTYPVLYHALPLPLLTIPLLDKSIWSGLVFLLNIRSINYHMPLALNKNNATIMHVDLNSCFATIEQQANPLLRGKPIVVAAYNSPNGCVVAPSIEAKRYGIKTGMTVRDARLLYPKVVVRTPDPAKYRAVHMMFRKIFRDYSPA